ncbi:MAG: lipase family protein [Gammaproteobacteria bacterium]|nr:lipase family protein [Gammaproteobacteria bacterium]
MFTQSSNYFFSFLMSLVVVFAPGAFATTHPGQDAIDFIAIQQYAEFSNAAYQAKAEIQQQRFSKNYSFTHYSKIPAIEISYFLQTDNIAKTQIIAVRGTSNIENAIVDVALKLTPDKHTGIRLHNGFSRAAQAIYAEIKPQLKTDYMISTTGHSLGGAVALILAMYLDVDNYQTGPVITFGQPKVTNVAGANKFQHLKVFRVVMPKDLVPLVPPLDPVDINDIDIYWHLGKEIVLLEANTYALLEGVSSMMRATRFTQQPLNESNLKDHQMSLYMNMLDKKIPAAKRVSFKHDFNLFNLFGGAAK